MKKKTLSSQVLKISLHGMDNKMQKMMVSYLELNCKRIALVVEESESQAEIIDIDLANTKSLLEERLAQQPPKPIIVLSLNEVSFENVIFVKKPIDIPSVINALKKIKKDLQKSNKVALKNKQQSKKVIDESEFEPPQGYENKLKSKIIEIEKSLDDSILATELKKISEETLISGSKEIQESDEILDIQKSASTLLNEQESLVAEFVDSSIHITKPQSNLVSEANIKIDSSKVDPIVKTIIS